jgi:hypothetical protein
MIHSRGSSPIYPRLYSGKDSIYYIYDGVVFLHSILSGQATTNISTLTIIQAIGQAFMPGKMGAFIIQVIFWAGTFLGLDRFLKQFSLTWKGRLFIFVCALAYAGFTFGDGNFGEEFALPVSLLALNIFYPSLKINSETSNDKTNRGKLIFYGITLLLLVNLKVIASATICAIIAAEITFSLQKKNWKQAFIKIFWLLVGMLIYLVPFVGYGLINRNLRLIISRYFFSGASYSVNKGNTFELFSRYNLFYFSFLIIPILLTIFSLRGQRKERKYFVFVIWNAVITLIALVAGHYYSHYLTINIATLVVGLSEILQNKEKNGFNRILTTQILRQSVGRWLYGIAFLILTFTIYQKATDCIQLHRDFLNVENPFAEIVQAIPQEERNSVVAYNVSPVWFDINHTIPSVDYIGIWMDYYASLNPELAEHFVHYLDTRPEWVLVGDSVKNDSAFFSIVQERYDKIMSITIESSPIKGLYGKHTLYRIR